MELESRTKISSLDIHSQRPTDRLCALKLSLGDFIPSIDPVSLSSGLKSHSNASATLWQPVPFVARPSAFKRNFGRTSAPESSSHLQSATGKSRSGSESFSLHSGRRLLENLPMIYQKRRSCSFCWLLYMATRAPGLGRPSGYDKLSSLGCAIEWKLDGRFVGAGSRTRRLRVFDPAG